MSKKKTRPASVKMLGMGEAPADLDFTESTGAEIAKAYNWYNYVYSQKDARTYLEKNNRKIEWTEVPHSRQNLTYAWIGMMIDVNCIFPDFILKKMRKYFAELERDFPKSKKKPEPVVAAVVEEIVPLYKERKHVADFDDIEDMIFRNGDYKAAEATFATFSASIPKYAAQELKDLIGPRLEELKSRDRDVKEAFSHMTVKDKRAMIDFYESCLNTLDFIHAAKKILSPRKKKAVPVDKKLKHLRFKKTDQDLSLASIDPEKMLGANVLWTFNSKYRELTRFESKAGFDLKGTTLQNVDKSERKRIRKPEIMKNFFGTTKAAMDRLFEEIKTTPSVHNCRINEETLLMKVF